MLDSLPIVSITPFTLQDFPGRAACILWFTGCNFRCPYCHNPDLALGMGTRVEWGQIERFLKSRVGLLEGVVFSGGECCLDPVVIELARRVKALGFELKVDTNGSRPEIVKELVVEELVDTFAIDFKAPLERYGEVAKWGAVEKWKQSIQIIVEAGVDLEIRTTVHSDLLHEGDVNLMMNELVDLGYRGRYYVQNFNEGETLDGLAKPEKRFDVGSLKAPAELELNLRNFTDREERAIR